MAAQATSPDTQGPPGKMGQIVVFVAMTLFAIGAGYGASVVLDNMHGQGAASDQAAPAESHGGETPAAAGGHGEEAPAGGHGASAAHGEEEAPPPGALVTMELPAIITNLAAPSETWIRLELAVRFVGTPTPQLIEDIHQDLMTYVRTMRLEQIEGPSGFLHFKSDLAERASIRSSGAARSVLIKVLLFE